MNNSNKYVIVNATALDKSGALTILKQFITSIPNDDMNWLIFAPVNVILHSDNPKVRIEPIKNVKSLFRRFLWDAFGIKEWLKRNNVNPIAAVSLQNTSFIVGKKVPTFIYYHQPIPFYDYKWNLLHKDERLLWFYKYVYPFFVRLFLKKDTEIFVQLEYIKQGFHKKFKHNLNKIQVYSPSVIPPNVSDSSFHLDHNKINVFFPATNWFYKNHEVLSKSLEFINRDIIFHFTCDLSNYKSSNQFKLHGSRTYDWVCKMYHTADALVFPSYIETFGLPLIEAAMTGLPILAADLPYAKEVLDGYEGVKFIKYNDQLAWAEAINNLEKDKRYKPLDISNRPGWKELFNKIKINILL